MLRAELSQANLALNSYMNRCAALSKETDEARAKVELHQGTIESLQITIGTLKDRDLIEDLEKARWYLDRKIEQMKENES